MYDNLQQQVNYLPNLNTGQLGIPFMEDLRIQNQIDSDCCIGMDAVSGLTDEQPGDVPKPLNASVPTEAVPPDKRGRQAKQSEARRTSEKAAKSSVGESAELIPGCSAVMPVTDDDSFDYRNYGTGSQY